MAQIIQTLLQLVVIQNQNQPQQAKKCAPRRCKVVESESEASSQMKRYEMRVKKKNSQYGETTTRDGIKSLEMIRKLRS